MTEQWLEELEALCIKIAARKPCTAQPLFLERMALGSIRLIAEAREAWADNAAMHKDFGAMLQDAQNENDELRQTVRHVRRFVDTVTGEQDHE